MNQIEVTIDRIVPEGKGVGTSSAEKYFGKAIYVLGAYPGEKVLAEVFREKNGFVEARLLEVITHSPNRIQAFESHYTSHSPWQSAKYEYQNELKREILKKCFKSLAENIIDDFDFFESPKKISYRTKLEFSFDESPHITKQMNSQSSDELGRTPENLQTSDFKQQTDIENHEVFLAFHERGSHKKMLRLGKEGCSLGNKKMNDYAFDVLKLINSADLQEFDLKSLVIRYSKFEDKVVGLLLLKNEKERVQNLIYKLQSTDYNQREIEDCTLKIDNFTVALSDFRSPMAKIDKILFQNGDDFLLEEICGLKFKYYLDSFFQNNIENFEHTIEIIKSRVGSGLSGEESNHDSALRTKKILELYSGVGTIGMHFANDKTEVIGVEVVESAVNSALENSRINGLTNYKATLLPAEKIDSSLLDGIDILIVDPPRTGLHKNIIKMIREKLPPQIVYLSCNPITQASDFNLIKEFYEIDYIAGMDYYPNTPHLESLLILRKKKF